MTDKQFSWFKQWMGCLAKREDIGSVQNIARLVDVHPSLFQKYFKQTTVPTVKRIVQLAVVDAMTTTDADDVTDDHLHQHVITCLNNVGMVDQLADNKIAQMIVDQRKRIRVAEYAKQQPKIRQQWSFDLQEMEDKDLQINVRIVGTNLLLEMQVRSAIDG